MKIKQLLPALLALALTSGLGCSKKSDDGPTVKECEKNNYGTVTVTYGSTTVRHSLIVVTAAGNRERQSAVGIASDTLRVHPGTVPIRVVSYSSTGVLLTTTTRSLTFTQCGDQAVSVTY